LGFFPILVHTPGKTVLSCLIAGIAQVIPDGFTALGRLELPYFLFNSLNPEYAFDHLLLAKMPVKLAVNSVSLTRHKDALCLARETANFFGLLALMTKFKCIIRV